MDTRISENICEVEPRHIEEDIRSTGSTRCIKFIKWKTNLCWEMIRRKQTVSFPNSQRHAGGEPNTLNTT